VFVCGATIKGLGKTFQVASFLSGLLRGGAATRALVVAPTTLLAQWQRYGGSAVHICPCRASWPAPLHLTRIHAASPFYLATRSELERCGLGGCVHSYGDGNRAAALTSVRSRGGVLLTSYGMVLHNATEVCSRRRNESKCMHDAKRRVC
jgi:hypothetical protein